MWMHAQISPADHPPRATRLDNTRFAAVLWLTFAFWGANIAAFTIANAVDDHPHLLAMTGMRLLLAVFGAGLCLGIYFVLRRIPQRSLWRRAAALIVLTPMAAETYAWAAYFGFSYVNHSALFTTPITLTMVISTLIPQTWFFFAWAALCMAVEYYLEARDDEVRVSELTALAQAAKLQALHNQINPHFLFNSLNSISALINDGRVTEADQMVVELGDYLRRTLSLDPTVDTRLSEEVALQEQYLRIEQRRYPDLSVFIDIPDDLKDAAAPALLLQPIVENAIKHGVARSHPPTAIIIRARREGDNLALEVENTGQPAAIDGAQPSGLGIGLNNVRERLATRFGPLHTLVTGNHDPGRYVVTIVFPLMM